MTKHKSIAPRPALWENLETRRLLATLSGFAFIDTDGDGVRGAGEYGVPGVRVELHDQFAETSRVAITSDLGFYAFTELSAGSYEVSAETVEAVQGGSALTSFPGAMAQGNSVSNIQLEEEDIATEINFGQGLINPAHVSSIWVLSSSASQTFGEIFREVVAGAEEAAGNVGLATLIREDAEKGKVANPIATTDQYEVIAGETLSVASAQGVLRNDLNPSGGSLTVELVRAPESGSLSLNPDGSFSYLADAEFSGEESFEYQAIAADSNAASAPIAVMIEVLPPPNRPPSGVEDSYQTMEDTTLVVDSFGVLANDLDADGDPLTALLVQPTTQGVVTLSNDGSFEYVPNDNFFGSDLFTYVARDAEFESAEVTVQITITPENDVPQGISDAYITEEDTTLVVAAADGVLANDVDVERDELTSILQEDVSNGTLTLANDGSFVYEPSPSFSGLDSFVYLANDGTDSSSATTVTIDVGAVNDTPVAIDDEFVTSEDTTFVSNVSLLANDIDPDGDVLTASIAEQPTNGVVNLNSDGTFEYVPGANFNGEDQFTYVASDGLRTSDPATVTISVAAVNDPPVALDDQYGINQGETLTIGPNNGILLNDGDIDGDLLTTVLIDGPTNGTVELAADGSFEYVASQGFAGIDTFTYRANDASNESNVGTVTISVIQLNNAPVAVDDSFEVNANDVLSIDAANGVIANDTDEDGDDLVAELTTEPSNGSVVLNDDGSFTYSPASDFSGVDSFTYVVIDGIASSSEATVQITVLAAPVVVTDTITLPASKDNSLFESATGSLSNGAGEYLFVGKTLQAENFLRRALIAFDFGQIPAGSTITNVSLTLNMSRTIVGSFDVNLHAVTQDWGEGISDALAEEGTGIQSETDDATWIHSFFNTQQWTTPGGDFVSDISATTAVDQVGFYTWNSAEMVADVQRWLDDPNTNAGWLLITDEIDITAKRFDSREHSNEANRPQLVVEYEFTTVSQAAAVSVNSVGEPVAVDLAFEEAGTVGETEPDVPLPGDIDLDGRVGFQDFLILASNFGRTDAAFVDGDLDGNETVDFSDFLALAQNFGTTA